MKFRQMPQSTTPVPDMHHELLPKMPRKGNPAARKKVRAKPRDYKRVPQVLKAVSAAAGVDYEDGPFSGLDVYQRMYLSKFCLHGQVRAACADSGIPMARVYIWRQHDQKFKAAEGIAMAIVADIVEGEALRRAVEGVEEPVYQGGKLVGTKQVYSDSILLRLLAGLKRERYGDASKLELTGKDGGPVSVEQVKLAALSDQELEQLAALQRKAIEGEA